MVTAVPPVGSQQVPFPSGPERTAVRGLRLKDEG